VVLTAGWPPSAEPAAELEAELLGLARARLPPSSVPRSVRFVPALPRTPAGRLHRAALHRLPGAES
jgi:fatty acid CoA ligase FadD22